MTLVWMSGWQMECCGAPFAVGDVVEWNLTTDVDVEWLAAALGTEISERITYSEDHHDERFEADTPTSVRIRRIRCAYCEYGPHVDIQKTLYPVPGTTSLVEVDRADGTEGRLSSLEFNGYVIEVDLAK